MKTLRYLLIVIGLLGVLCTRAQDFNDMPVLPMHSTAAMTRSGSALFQTPGEHMHSTSTMRRSGSTLSSAQVTSAFETLGKPRRGADEGDEPPADPQGPYEEPIGDGVWIMLLMAGAYVALRQRMKKSRIFSK